MTATTIRQQLTLIRQQNTEIIRLLTIIARHQQTAACGCLPPNVHFPEDLPPIPILEPELPDTPYTPGGDPTLCKRIQREIDNILIVWEQIIDIAQVAGIVSVTALAAIIGAKLAPETAGLSAVGLAALAAGVNSLIAEAGSEIGDVPQATRERAAKAAYNARGGGAASASSAALQVLRNEQPVFVTENAFAIFWRMWGGLRRAFDMNADIGDWTSYPEICRECYGHANHIDLRGEIIYRWNPPIQQMNSIPGTIYQAGFGVYFRVPNDTVFRNMSQVTVEIFVWNYNGVMYIDQTVPPGGSVTIPVTNGGYVRTIRPVVCPPDTLRFCIP